jgi:hypothetical protein
MVAATFQSKPTSAGSPRRFGRWLARLALAVGVVCALAALTAGPLYRAELLLLGPAIQTMR